MPSITLRPSSFSNNTLAVSSHATSPMDAVASEDDKYVYLYAGSQGTSGSITFYFPTSQIPAKNIRVTSVSAYVRLYKFNPSDSGTVQFTIGSGASEATSAVYSLPQNPGDKELVLTGAPFNWSRSQLDNVKVTINCNASRMYTYVDEVYIVVNYEYLSPPIMSYSPLGDKPTIHWLNDPGAISYTVYSQDADTSEIITPTVHLPPGSSKYQFTNQGFNRNVTYYVRAVYSNGTSPYASTTQRTATDKPKDVSVSNITSSSARINWTLPTGAKEVSLQVLKNGQIIAQYPSQTGTYKDLSGLEPTTQYVARLTAISSAFNHLSETVEISFETTQGKPTLAPTITEVTHYNHENVYLSWTSVPAATGYKIKIGYLSGQSWLYDNVTISGDTLNRTLSLSPNTSYSFTVCGYNSEGDGPHSSSKDLITGPAATLEVTSTAVSPSAVSLSWSPVPKTTGYRVRYGLSAESMNTVIDAGAVVHKLIEGLSSGVRYYFAIEAYNENGNSPSSSIVSTVTLLLAPQIDNISANVNNVSISWNSVVGATGYKVKWGLSSESYTESQDVGNSLSYSIPASSLDPEQIYYFIVIAYNEFGESPPSEYASIETPQNVVARLKSGDFLVSGEIKEREPAITDGLIAYFPFDGTEYGIQKDKNLLDYSVWKVGTNGSQGNFSINGSVNENTITTHMNPWGAEDVVWASLNNDEASNADGGWNVTNIPIDNTKKYRLSVWIRRENVGDGRTYLGCQHNTVTNLGSETPHSNPYFASRLISHLPEMADNWLLWVGHIHPHDYTGSRDPKSGIYMVNGEQIDTLNDFKWTPETTVGGHRSYFHYSTTTDERQYWYRPRFEVCDGTEVPIEELLRGSEHPVQPQVNQNTIATSNGLLIDRETQNHLVGSTEFDKWEDNWGNTTVIPNATFDPYGGFEADLIKGDPNQHTLLYKTLTVPAGSIHTYYATVFVKPISTRMITLNVYYPGNSEDNVHFYFDTKNVTGVPYPDEYIFQELDDGWYRIGFRISKDSTGTKTTLLYRIWTQGRTLDYPGDCYLWGAQLERKPYPSFPTKNSRGIGDVKIPVDIGTSNFTIMGEFIPSSDLRYMGLDGYFLNLGGGFILQAYGEILYLNASTITGESGHTDYKNFRTVPGARYYYIVKREGTTFKWRMLGDDGQDVTWEVTHPNVSTKVVDTLNFYGSWGGIHRNLMIYNRALSEEEIRRSITKPHSLNREGDLRASIVEGPNSIPSDSILFPLGSGGADRELTIFPSIEIGAAYENGALWVGEATTNILMYPNVDAPAWEKGYNKNIVYSYDGPVPGEVVATFEDADEDGSGYWYSYGDYAPQEDGTTYTVSLWVKTEVPVEIAAYTGDNNENGRIRSEYITVYPEEGWKRVIWNPITTNNPNDSDSLSFRWRGLNPGARMSISAPQMEVGTFATPFTHGTRSNTNVQINNPLIDVANNKWTIFGFYNKYDYQSNSYFLTKIGSRAFRIGNYSDRSFSPYWNSSSGGASRGTNPAHEKITNKWKFFAMTRSENTISIYDGMDGILYHGIYDTLGNRFNEHTTAGWQIQSSNFNGYVRDLGFLQRTLTSEEIEKIYKTHMQFYKGGGLLIQGQIKEGQVL